MIYTTNNTLTIYNKINNSRVNKQLTNHSSATEREIAEEQRWFLSGKLVARVVKFGQLAKSDRQLCRPTKLSDKVAQLCCVSDIGLTRPGVLFSRKSTLQIATGRVLDRLKQVDVRTYSRKKFGVQAAFAGRMPYFTIIRPIITVHNIVHIIVPPPASKNVISKHMQTTQYSLQTHKSTPYNEIVCYFLYC